MAETCPFSETSRCRDRDETETLKNSISRLSRDRDLSRDTTALCGYGHTKMRTKKNILFHLDEKCTKTDENERKRMKNGYCVIHLKGAK